MRIAEVKDVGVSDTLLRVIRKKFQIVQRDLLKEVTHLKLYQLRNL